MLISLDRSWRSQPKVAQPAAKDFRASLIDAQNFAPMCIVGNTITGTVPFDVADRVIGPKFSADSANYITRTVPRISELTGPMTAVVVFTRLGSGQSGTDNLLLAADCGGDWIATPFLLSVYNSGEIQIGRCGSGGFHRSWIKSSETPASVGKTCAAVFRSTATHAGNGLASQTTMFCNGQRLTSTAAYEDGTTNTIGYTSTTVYIGRQPTAITGGHFGLNAVVAAYGLFKVALSDAECYSLSVNPWQMFEPLPSLRMMFADAAAPAYVRPQIHIPRTAVHRASRW